MFLYYGTPLTFNMILFVKRTQVSTYFGIFKGCIRAADYHPIMIIEPLYDKTNEINYAPTEDSDQTGRIRVLSVRSMSSKWPFVAFLVRTVKTLIRMCGCSG